MLSTGSVSCPPNICTLSRSIWTTSKQRQLSCDWLNVDDQVILTFATGRPRKRLSKSTTRSKKTQSGPANRPKKRKSKPVTRSKKAKAKPKRDGQSPDSAKRKDCSCRNTPLVEGHHLGDQYSLYPPPDKGLSRLPWDRTQRKTRL